MLAEYPYDSGRDCKDISASIYPRSARYEPSSQCFLDVDQDGYGDAFVEYPYDVDRDCYDSHISINEGAIEGL